MCFTTINIDLIEQIGILASRCGMRKKLDDNMDQVLLQLKTEIIHKNI